MKPHAAALFSVLRTSLHERLASTILSIDSEGVPTLADKDNVASCEIGTKLAERLGAPHHRTRQEAQTSGGKFEEACTSFLNEAFNHLRHLRPGEWRIGRLESPRSTGVAAYSQYAHLSALRALAKQNAELAAALGTEYQIAPDVVIARQPASDEEINAHTVLVNDGVAKLTDLRSANSGLPILHAVVSCKWTIRSDRAQNSRTEALNLIRNRKGRVPHIVVITAEPLPSRLASIALGTGDIDRVYHLGLPELLESIEELARDSSGYSDGLELMKTMVDGRRMFDIADLPLDLAT